MQIDEVVLFYGDFNCPFCFAQHDRIARVAATERVDFRPIQHMPDLPAPMETTNEAELATLREELEKLRERAPEVMVRIPAGRPNTRVAALAYAATRRRAPEHAMTFARAVFRALWNEGKDISLSETIEAIGVSLELDLSIDARIEDDVARWQHGWESGEFDRRLPSLMSPRGGTLLGLAEEEGLRSFVATGRISSVTDEFC